MRYVPFKNETIVKTHFISMCSITFRGNTRFLSIFFKFSCFRNCETRCWVNWSAIRLFELDFMLHHLNRVRMSVARSVQLSKQVQKFANKSRVLFRWGHIFAPLGLPIFILFFYCVVLIYLLVPGSVRLYQKALIVGMEFNFPDCVKIGIPSSNMYGAASLLCRMLLKHFTQKWLSWISTNWYAFAVQLAK